MGRYCYPDAAIECWAPATGDALLEIVGVGFSETLGAAEAYQCLLRDESSGVTVYSDAEVASGNLLRCKTAAFPGGSLAVAVGVVSPFSAELSLLSARASFPVFLEATVDSGPQVNCVIQSVFGCKGRTPPCGYRGALRIRTEH